MTIDDLKYKGKEFYIKTTEFHTTFENGMHIIYQPTSYIENGDDFLKWVQTCKRYIMINYPNDIAADTFRITEIKKMTQEDIYNLVAVLESLKEIPKVCEYKSNSVSSIINVNQNQSQIQKQNIDVLLSTIKEELKEKDYAEIEAILKSRESSLNKKNKIIEKLMSFGENVAASIIASVLMANFKV